MTILGIPIKVHPTFWLLPGWLMFSQQVSHHNTALTLISGLVVLLVFVFVVLHEYGHALIARHFGIETHDITLLPIGGLAHLERMPKEPKQELLITAAGPLVNVVCAGLLYIPYSLLPDTFLRTLLSGLMLVNVYMAVFNLIPAFPMDGGRILRALLTFRFGYNEATVIAAEVSTTLSIIMGVLGVIYVNVTLVIIAFFIFIYAQSIISQGGESGSKEDE